METTDEIVPADEDPRKYIRIARELKKEMALGILESGEIVTIAELSKDFKVSRQTARRALKVIERDGYISACGTVGFVVTDGKRRESSRSDMEPSRLDLEVPRPMDMIIQSLDNISEDFQRLHDAVCRLDAKATKLAEDMAVKRAPAETRDQGCMTKDWSLGLARRPKRGRTGYGPTPLRAPTTKTHGACSAQYTAEVAVPARVAAPPCELSGPRRNALGADRRAIGTSEQ